jgi:hypothetical protein
MSRVTAAFVCALDDPNNARPASIMCSNNCGRYVCAEHAMERKGPGSPMVCLVCAKALGILPAPKAEKIALKPEPVAAPIMPAPEPRKAVRAEVEPIDFAPKAEVKPIAPVAPMAEVKPIEPPAPPRSDPDATMAGLAFAPSIKEEATSPISLQGAVPLEEQKVAPSMLEPEAEPKSAASETIVSQRGNTLQVPKVTASTPRTGNTGQMPKVRTGQTGQMPAARPAQRTTESTAGGLQNQVILWAIGAIVLGIIGFALIVAALNG